MQPPQTTRFWKKFFDRYGIESEIIPLPFGHDRANIIARVRGSKSGLRPILLLNHMDVVPAESSRWTVPPFSGEIRNGIIFGRGTFDMKATGTYQALMLARAKAQKWEMNRDLIFLGTSNEEGPFDPVRGVISGAEWMLKNRGEVLGNPEFVVTEGGYIPTASGRPVRWEVSPGEKARLELTFSVKPANLSDAEKLLIMARAALKLVSEFKGKVELASEMVHWKQPTDKIERANRSTTHALTILGGVGKGNTIPATAVAEVVLQTEPKSRGNMERTLRTLLPEGTRFEVVSQEKDRVVLHFKSAGEAGHASLPPLDGGANLLLTKSIVAIDIAIQQKKLAAKALTVRRLASVSDEHGRERAEFALDFRLLPSESRDAVLDQVRRLIKGLPIALKITDDAVQPGASSTNTALFAAINSANKKFHPDPGNRPPVETPILNSTTDAAYFRQRGMIVYGFEPIMLDPHDEHSHGDNEHVSVDAMRFATDVTEFYLKQFLGVGAKPSPKM
jgi:acetylornithine deacetylase/succinyl-diaminopimelate desuccinylase-like protein